MVIKTAPTTNANFSARLITVGCTASLSHSSIKPSSVSSMLSVAEPKLKLQHRRDEQQCNATNQKPHRNLHISIFYHLSSCLSHNPGLPYHLFPWPPRGHECIDSLRSFLLF